MLFLKTFKKFSTNNKQPKILTQLFINGQYVNSLSGKKFKVYNPSTEQVITEVQEGGALDIDLAVRAARKAFDEGPWSKMSGSERGKLIFKLADLIEQNADELAMLE